jgi:hypothetical protein
MIDGASTAPTTFWNYSAMNIARDIALVVDLEVGGQLSQVTDCVVDKLETRA